MRAAWLTWAHQKVDELENAQKRYAARGPDADMPIAGLEALEEAEAALRRFAALMGGEL